MTQKDQHVVYNRSPAQVKIPVGPYVKDVHFIPSFGKSLLTPTEFGFAKETIDSTPSLIT